MNDKIIEMLNSGKEDAVIIYYIHDNSNLSLNEAREKLSEAKKWGAWYTHTSNKEKTISQYEN